MSRKPRTIEVPQDLVDLVDTTPHHIAVQYVELITPYVPPRAPYIAFNPDDSLIYDKEHGYHTGKHFDAFPFVGTPVNREYWQGWVATVANEDNDPLGHFNSEHIKWGSAGTSWEYATTQRSAIQDAIYMQSKTHLPIHVLTQEGTLKKVINHNTKEARQ